MTAGYVWREPGREAQRSKVELAIKAEEQKLVADAPKKPRGLKPCGTVAAYQRHRDKGEEPCGPCKRAKSEYDRESGVQRRSRPWKPTIHREVCGTTAGYKKHIYHRDRPCYPCSEAIFAYNQTRKETK